MHEHYEVIEQTKTTAHFRNQMFTRTIFNETHTIRFVVHLHQLNVID